MIIPKDPITRDEYYARVDAGVPYEGPVKGMGYAMKEMVVTPRSTNKSKNRIFWNISYLNVSITLKRDAIQPRDRTNEIHTKQQDIAKATENQQRQVQIVQELKVKLDAYYKYVIGEAKKLPGFNFRAQAAFEEEKKKVTRLIEDKNTPLIYSQLPRTFYIQNLALLHELGSYRNHNGISIPNKNEQLKGNWPEQYQTERMHMDPFAAKMAQQPAIKAVAVTGVVLMGAEGAAWLGKKEIINTSAKTIFKEGAYSTISQLIIEKNINEINAVSLLTDMFLTRYAGYAVGTIVEYRPLSEELVKFKYVGNGIDIEETVIQFIEAFCIGKGSDYISSKTKNINMLPQYELYKNELIDILESVVSYQIGNEISTIYEQEVSTKK